MAEQTQIFDVLKKGYGDIDFKESTPAQSQRLDESLVPYPRDSKGRITIDHERVATLQESGGAHLSTPNFPDMLRQGLIFDAWTRYNETVVTYPQFVRTVQSSKQQEEYLFDSPVGLPAIVAEGQPYPEVATDFSHGLIIRNNKRGMIMSVTMEAQMFDQVGKVRETAELMGRSMRLEEEYAVMNVVTTTGNYTRTNTDGDNDETATGSGANQQTLTFSANGLIAAFNILRTMKDRKTGQYLSVMPDTLIVTPKLWWAVKQLLGSPDTMRAANTGGSAELFGTGTVNSFYNAISKIIVSPIFGNGYQWSMMESGRAVTFQRVLPISVLFEGQSPQNTQYFERDVLRYRVSNFFGVGMRDDRFAFFSNSTTAPTVS